MRGDASQMIQSLESTNQNYDIARSLLKERYENKRLIIQTHVSALFNLPTITRESHTSLRQLLDSVTKQLRALRALDEPVDQWDTLINHLLISKVDNITRREWESSSVSNLSPTLVNLTDFLKSRCQILESIEAAKQSAVKSAPGTSHKAKSQSTTLLTTAKTTPATVTCFLCKESHYLYQCAKFLSLPVQQRLKEAQNLKLCLNCLRNNHGTEDCHSPKTCKTCAKQHNSLLHLPIPTSNSVEETPTQVCSHITTFNQVLLATALIDIIDANGKSHPARALLDAGSQINFITRTLSNKLQLELHHIKIPIVGINHTNSQVTQSVSATIKSKITSFTSNLTFMILNQITTNLPIININLDCLKIPSSIKLADPNFHTTSPIDILLGAEIFWNLLCVGQIKLAHNQPFLQKTLLGYVVSGRYIPESHNSTNTAVCNLVTKETLSEQLMKFWTIEEDNKHKYLTREEQICEDKFITTTTRNADDRFVMELPFKTNPLSLGESKEIATKRFLTLERKLERDPELKKQYSEFMNDYLQLGHMRILPSEEQNTWPHCYLPHHAVLKADSTTTKLRVVFDDSCKSLNGVSLNDCLLVGPQIQQDLVNIITRFRIHKYVITADVAKMYRQIEVTPDHTHYQRILWRNSSDDPLETYNLTTVTYGTAPASFLAIRSLIETAHEQRNKYQEAAIVIQRDFYVDDLITGVDTVLDGIQLINDISAVLKTGGFELRKWKSNEMSLFCPHLTSNSSNTLELEKDMQDKILGLTWNSSDDHMKYSVAEQEPPIKVTKRLILSRISRIFDPLGLVGPVIITAKLLLQKLWQLKSEWDESVPEIIYSEWIDYSNHLNSLNNLSIPRRITQDNIKEAAIHGFSDASESAYGACLYLWTANEDNTIKTSLICGKSRVAPLKQISLPRLELCGAQLLVQLYRKIVPTLGIKIDKQYYWTDSKIVLDWIRSESKIWKTFVANRVGEIQEHTRLEDWRHVTSADNPADLLSRGVHPATLATCDLWWNGPNWLQHNELHWPECDLIQLSENDIQQELKTTSLITIKEIPTSNELFIKYSSFTKLQRVVSYCFRFCDNLRKQKTERKIGLLQPEELNKATTCIIKIIQMETFIEDILHLKKFKQPSRKSRLLALNPFLDGNELLRVGGRLEHSSLQYNTKHPIILPPKHVVTKLIINHEHIRLFHAGAATSLANIRQKYWPIAGLTSVKSVIQKCVKCFRAHPYPIQHLMGQLPQPRVDQPTRPFVETGIDYCGPIMIREGTRRSRRIIKAYIAIFVCFSTKATHLEVVLDLSTESFLSALKRYMSRRGKPNTLHSDNGTNFGGAECVLTEFLHSQDFENGVIERIQQEGINWKFIPPRSPHFHHTTVKSFKTHFKRTVGNASLNYEELLTVTVQIEACLNSRPLTPISTDPNDLTVLTPSHFLIGDLLTAPMEQDVRNINENRLARWQRVQQLKQSFWSRWSTEYVARLQKRTKWKHNIENVIKEGCMVIIKDDQQPPLRWSIGRVISIHPGKDGITRAATIRTSRGDFVRASTKLCLLPIDSPNEDE